MPSLPEPLRCHRASLILLMLAAPSLANAGGVPGALSNPETVLVTGASQTIAADSASIGTVYAEQFQNRPLSRPAELLEVVPGLIVTQHSGEGKANQYFLRGFNLDHGTDFASFVDGMPVNMPSHAHGQGYTDLNFLIPELVDAIEYRKGPYYAEYGDFSSAGVAEMRLREQVDAPQMLLSGGSNGYARLLALGSRPILDGVLLAGAEGLHYDGPWQRSNRFNKGSGLLRFSRHQDGDSLHLSAMAYSARWNATDQIPQRAVEQGLVSRLGCLDCSDGGQTYRYSLAGDFGRALGPGHWQTSAYAIAYQLDLYSNFTYFLNDPLHGDQFEQFDRRRVYGGQSLYQFLPVQLGGGPLRSQLGIQTRFDDIAPVALYRTQQRARVGTISRNEVEQWSQAVHAQTQWQALPWLSGTAGLRYDRYEFEVSSDLPANSGSRRDHVFSPKLNLALGPFGNTRYFLNLGRGFHSNDARGTTQTVNPGDGLNPVRPVTPLAVSSGADLGLRSRLLESLQLSLSTFILHLDSELTFGGDSNDTEPNRASTRYGLELSTYWTPITHLLVDLDIAYTHARFRDSAPEGRYIPESATGVASLGLSYDQPDGWFGALRLRHFGPRPLIEDNSVRSQSTSLVNLDLGVHFGTEAKLALQVLNLINSRDHDIDYFFTSRLPGEPDAGVSDLHFHPVEPRSLRLLLSWTP